MIDLVVATNSVPQTPPNSKILPIFGSFKVLVFFYYFVELEIKILELRGLPVSEPLEIASSIMSQKIVFFDFCAKK